MSRIIIETCERGFRGTEEEASDLAGRGQEKSLGGPDIHLGLARGRGICQVKKEEKGCSGT